MTLVSKNTHRHPESRMPENPLLPDAELRALLALTRRAATLDGAAERRRTGAARRQPSSLPGREAVLAATTLQLGPGDLFVPDPADTTAIALATRSDQAPGPTIEPLPGDLGKANSRLLLASAMALALRQAKTDRVVLLVTQTGVADPAWTSALAWAQEALLPLIVVCTDACGPAAFTSQASPAPKTFAWTTASRVATRLQLPVLTLDGEDAVAMYRGTQEALLRARSGGGPAILWAALPTAGQRAAQTAVQSRNQRPLMRLAKYLRARHISPS